MGDKNLKRKYEWRGETPVRDFETVSPEETISFPAGATHFRLTRL